MTTKDPIAAEEVWAKHKRLVALTVEDLVAHGILRAEPKVHLIDAPIGEGQAFIIDSLSPGIWMRPVLQRPGQIFAKSYDVRFGTVVVFVDTAKDRAVDTDNLDTYHCPVSRITQHLNHLFGGKRVTGLRCEIQTLITPTSFKIETPNKGIKNQIAGSDIWTWFRESR